MALALLAVAVFLCTTAALIVCAVTPLWAILTGWAVCLVAVGLAIAWTLHVDRSTRVP